jgi:hypothetical protein
MTLFLDVIPGVTIHVFKMLIRFGLQFGLCHRGQFADVHPITPTSGFPFAQSPILS